MLTSTYHKENDSGEPRTKIFLIDGSIMKHTEERLVDHLPVVCGVVVGARQLGDLAEGEGIAFVTILRAQIDLLLSVSK